MPNSSFTIKAGAGNGTVPIFTSTKIVSLGNSGIVSDADLSFGSSTFGTDQTSAIQTLLNTASSTNPLYLFWDCAVSHTGLTIKSHTYIFALPNCGAILRDNSDNFLFKNYGWVAGGNTLVDFNITIEGGIWNANGFRGGVAKQVHSSSSNGMTTGFCFIGVKNLNILNSNLLNTRTYGCLILTMENVIIDGLNIDDGSSAVINQDGIDLCGYAKNVIVQNCRLRTGDDSIICIANPTGGNAFGEHHEPYTGIAGDQDGIYIRNIYFDSTSKGIQLYCTGGNKMQNYFISDLSGKCQTNWFAVFNADILSGYTFATGSYVVDGLWISNINVEVTNYASYDQTYYALCMFQGSAKNVTIDNVNRTDQTYAHETFGIYKRTGGSTSVTVSNIKITNYGSYNTSPGNAINQIYIHDATVNNLSLNGNTVDVGSSTQNAAFVNIGASTTINLIHASNNSINGLKYFLNNAGTISLAIIAGIAHTGQGGSDPTVINSGTFTKLIMSPWSGVLATSGTFGTTSNGNAF